MSQTGPRVRRGVRDFTSPLLEGLGRGVLGVVGDLVNYRI